MPPFKTIIRTAAPAARRQSNTTMRSFTIPALALAGLMSAMLAQAPEPAVAAAATAASCNAKAAACHRRCAANGDSNWQNCVFRTCEKQYKNCMASIGGGGKNRPVVQTPGLPLPGNVNTTPRPKIGVPGGGGGVKPPKVGGVNTAPGPKTGVPGGGGGFKPSQSGGIAPGGPKSGGGGPLVIR